LDYFTISSRSKRVVEGRLQIEGKIMEIWPSKKPQSRLGLVVTMVGHGI